MDDLSLKCGDSEGLAEGAMAAEQRSRDPAPGDVVPPLLHFVFGLSHDFGGKPFGLAHHLVIKSAIKKLSPFRTYLYYAHEPSGEWWEVTQPPHYTHPTYPLPPPSPHPASPLPPPYPPP